MLTPKIVGEWWTIATNPDLGEFSTARQQPMDFSIWQAADGSWQLGACVRGTSCGGEGRLLWRWQSDSLDDEHWQSAGLLLLADTDVGETLGGLQAPYVVSHGGRYHMHYGDWVNICYATSSDGKHFSRVLQPNGQSALFNEGRLNKTRDPMLFVHEGIFYVYYTGVVDDVGAIYCRTSTDLTKWGPSCIVSRGGVGGSGPSDAECAFVTQAENSDLFYLFRWHSNGSTAAFCSDNMLDFGVDNDDKKIASLPVEVARIIQSEEGMYISSLKDDYTGIRLARFEWQAA